MDKKVIDHSFGVGLYMKEHAKSNKEEMFLLGLLHDIGKIEGYENHEINGAHILNKVGFKYYKEVELHGLVQDGYSSYELDLLNSADLSIDSNGNNVGYKKRIDDIKNRYGKDSNEYINACILSKQLIKKGFLSDD